MYKKSGSSFFITVQTQLAWILRDHPHAMDLLKILDYVKMLSMCV